MLPLLVRDGWILLRGALAPAEVERLRLAFSPMATGTEHVRITPATPGAEAWTRLGEHPEVRALATALLGPCHVRDAHGRAPGPGLGQQGLHRDQPDGPHAERPRCVTALWMLDPFEAENGATRVVTGSHVLRGPPRSLAQPLANHPDETIVTGQPGDVLLFDGRLWHSGRRNTVGRPRRCVQMVFVAT